MAHIIFMDEIPRKSLGMTYNSMVFNIFYVLLS